MGIDSCYTIPATPPGNSLRKAHITCSKYYPPFFFFHPGHERRLQPYRGCCSNAAKQTLLETLLGGKDENHSCFFGSELFCGSALVLRIAREPTELV